MLFACIYSVPHTQVTFDANSGWILFAFLSAVGAMMGCVAMSFIAMIVDRINWQRWFCVPICAATALAVPAIGLISLCLILDVEPGVLLMLLSPLFAFAATDLATKVAPKNGRLFVAKFMTLLVLLSFSAIIGMMSGFHADASLIAGMHGMAMLCTGAAFSVVQAQIAVRKVVAA